MASAWGHQEVVTSLTLTLRHDRMLNQIAFGSPWHYLALGSKPCHRKLVLSISPRKSVRGGEVFPRDRLRDIVSGWGMGSFNILSQIESLNLQHMGFSNHWQMHCLFNSSCGLPATKISKPHFIGLLCGESPGDRVISLTTVGNAKSISMLHHHALKSFRKTVTDLIHWINYYQNDVSTTQVPLNECIWFIKLVMLLSALQRFHIRCWGRLVYVYVSCDTIEYQVTSLYTLKMKLHKAYIQWEWSTHMRAYIRKHRTLRVSDNEKELHR